MEENVRERNDYISKKLQAFSFARIQEYYGLLLDLKKHDITRDEFMSWVRFAVNEHVIHGKNSLPKQESYYCPECSNRLILLDVNSKRCNQVGGGYKSMFSCIDKIGCGHSRYSTNSAKTWMSILNSLGNKDATSKMLKGSSVVVDMVQNN